MHQRTLHNVVQRRAKQRLRWIGKTLAEAETAQYSTHSLRRGALTSMGGAGATVSEMLDLSRHSPSSARIMLG